MVTSCGAEKYQEFSQQKACPFQFTYNIDIEILLYYLEGI